MERKQELCPSCQSAEDSIIQHIYLEYPYLDIVYDMYCWYDGCHELTNHIYEKIVNSKNGDTIVINLKDTDKIVIDIEWSNFNFIEYDYKNIDFNKIHLICSYDHQYPDRIKYDIAHTLLHIYEQYNLKIQGYPSNSIYIYKSIKPTKHRYSLRELLEAIEMVKSYQNGGLIKISKEDLDKLRQMFKKFGSINYDHKPWPIFVDLQNFKIYKLYLTLIEYIESWSNGFLSLRQTKGIISKWSELYNENKTIDEIFKIIKHTIVDIKYDFETLLIKLIRKTYNSEFINTIHQ